MKIKALILTLAFLFNTFCLPLQQSFAQTNADFPDSQVYFQKTVQRPPLRDRSREIEALLKKMTVEEKVGQMTQLTMGMFVSGQRSGCAD